MFFEPLLNDWNNRAEAVFDSFLNYPIDGGAFPLNLHDIATAQQDNPIVTGYLLNAPERFELINYSGNNLICRRSSNGQWKIVLPESLTELAIKWYHALTAHGGSSCIRDSIGAFFWCSKLRESVEHYVSICDACQRYKDVGRGQGQLPPRRNCYPLVQRCCQLNWPMEGQCWRQGTCHQSTDRHRRLHLPWRNCTNRRRYERTNRNAV
jgi:hypothetical protein